MLEVPASCIRSIDTVPKPLVRQLPKSISVHGLLAADLALDRSGRYAAWDAVCPTPADFAGMPLVWPPELRAYLPLAARDLLAKQDAKLARDWAAVAKALAHGQEDLDEARYRHAWMLVNTRTFYYVNARLQRRCPDDHMCLLPVADLFNHGDNAREECNVAFDRAGFEVTAARRYARGEELKICYGSHSNDFLLVEYGFAMDGNKWDEARLDEVLVPQLSAHQREKLDAVGFWERYVLDRETECYRTQVVVRLLCCGFREWKRFMDGIDDGERSKQEVAQYMIELLKELRLDAGNMICQVGALKVGEPQQRESLADRWEQIEGLAAMNIARLKEDLNRNPLPRLGRKV